MSGQKGKPDHQNRDPDFEAKVRDSFSRQGLARHLGLRLDCLAPGRCTISLPFRLEVAQQHGYFHGGAVGTVADNAAGYAAMSLVSPGESVLTVGYKVNLLEPAKGSLLVAEAEVLRPGRLLTVCDVRVHAEEGGLRRLCASAAVTLVTLRSRGDGPAGTVPAGS